MALIKQNRSKTMSFGEHRDLQKILDSASPGEKKRINVNFDKEIHIRFKAACAKRGTSITNVIKELVDNWLEENNS